MAAGVLPVGLTQLSFGDDFNQPVAADVLPAGLTQLTFGVHFNQPVVRACCLLVWHNLRLVIALLQPARDGGRAACWSDATYVWL